MKVLITGGSGLLGQFLNSGISKDHDIVTLYNTNPGNCNDHRSFRIDLTDWKELKELTGKISPDVVIHTAAISRPEICDQLSKEFVRKVNVEVTENLSGLCADAGSRLMFTSTDLVYDGNSGGMMSEEDLINPQSRYAESKAIAEEKVRSSGCRHFILRTSLLYGIGMNHTMNNFHSAYLKFKKGEETQLFYDQFRTPLAIHDAARLINELIDKDSPNSTLNFGGRERVSRVELGERLCEAGGFDKKLIRKISMYDVDGVHKVADVSMNTGRLNSLGLVQESIDMSIKVILSHNERENNGT